MSKLQLNILQTPRGRWDNVSRTFLIVTRSDVLQIYLILEIPVGKVITYIPRVTSAPFGFFLAPFFRQIRTRSPTCFSLSWLIDRWPHALSFLLHCRFSSTPTWAIYLLCTFSLRWTSVEALVPISETSSIDNQICIAFFFISPPQMTHSMQML